VKYLYEEWIDTGYEALVEAAAGIVEQSFEVTS
jgi:hypothetical protein